MIDKSESNFNCDELGPCGQLALNHTGTDPQNRQRADRIEQFFNGIGQSGMARRDDPNISWGYIAFSSVSWAFINDGNDTNPTFVGLNDDPNSISQMEAALARQRGADGGGTKYLSAMALASKAIANDMKKPGSENSHYVVFFMTDGLPDDFGGSQPAQQQHFDAVDSLVQISPGRIRFNTAFYGPPEIEVGASKGLQTMAEHGNGRFVNLNLSDDFLVDDLLKGTDSVIPYKLKSFHSFLVYNLNSAVCFDHQWGADSDSDGLCDSDEIALAQSGWGTFDPASRFSFDPNFGDYFHYLSRKFGEALPSCTLQGQIAGDMDHDLLTPCEESYMRNLDAPSWLGTLEADPENPDTDGDGILDGIEYLTLRNRSAAVDPTNLLQHYDSDLETAYQQIMVHRNPLVPDSGLTVPHIYDTELRYQGLGAAGGSCYTVHQTSLATYPLIQNVATPELPHLAHAEDENLVLIYYLEVPEDNPSAKGVYRFSIQKVRYPMGPDLQISDSVFSTYVVPAKK